MKDSSTRKRRLNWEEYSSPKLSLHENVSKVSKFQNFDSCGTSALSLITGIKTNTIDKFNKNKESFTTGTAIRYLKSKGYTVTELSKEDILNYEWYLSPLHEEHCLLMNIRVNKEENSMFVFHKNELWHNLSIEHTRNGLFFLNKPTQDVLIISHKKWK